MFDSALHLGSNNFKAYKMGDHQDRAELDQRLQALLALTGPRSQPNFNTLLDLVKDIDFIKLNLKFFGYELARSLAAALPPRDVSGPRVHALAWKPTTQADLESDWAAYWLGQLKIAFIYHRKLWESVYLLQALHNHGLIRPGVRGLGFGCGEEPFPSYFASKGMHTTVTDLAPHEQASRGWAASGQHASSLDRCFMPALVERDDFFALTKLEFVDMNALSPTLRDFDFCWSICALEHLGSIENGLNFIENSLDTLKPGGVAVHTTEFNFYDDGRTIDNWACVYFQKRHFLALAERLRQKGYEVPELDFDLGTGPMDRFIDLPPYAHQVSGSLRSLWASETHLKLANDGFASTCYGLIVKKPG